MIEFDLGVVEPSIAGPSRPHDRIPLSAAKERFRALCAERRLNLDARAEIDLGDGCFETAPGVQMCTTAGRRDDLRGVAEVGQGAIAIAAITSCTTTADPAMMVTAGLLARNARAAGLLPKPWVKCILAPGSQSAYGLLEDAGLLDDLAALSFSSCGFGCMSCIGNSGSIVPALREATDRLELASVLSGNRNFEGRQGKGNVVRQMFREIEADYYLMVDGDDTYPAEAAPDLVEPLVAGLADMTVGDRLSNGSYGEENDRAFHGFGNNLVRWLIKTIYGYAFDDVMTGYRAFTRQFVKTMPVLSAGFQIETEISIHAVDHRWRIVDVPIEYRDRPEGSYSKLSTFGDGAKVLMAIASLFKDCRPMAFFGWLALLFVILGLVAGVPVIAEFVTTGLVSKLPSAVLAVALVICGALSMTVGLVLDTVAKSQRKAWELEVYRATEERA